MYFSVPKDRNENQNWQIAKLRLLLPHVYPEIWQKNIQIQQLLICKCKTVANKKKHTHTHAHIHTHTHAYAHTYALTHTQI